MAPTKPPKKKMDPTTPIAPPIPSGLLLFIHNFLPQHIRSSQPADTISVASKFAKDTPHNVVSLSISIFTTDKTRRCSSTTTDPTDWRGLSLRHGMADLAYMPNITYKTIAFHYFSLFSLDVFGHWTGVAVFDVSDMEPLLVGMGYASMRPSPIQSSTDAVCGL